MYSGVKTVPVLRLDELGGCLGRWAKLGTKNGPEMQLCGRK